MTTHAHFLCVWYSSVTELMFSSTRSLWYFSPTLLLHAHTHARTHARTPHTHTHTQLIHASLQCLTSVVHENKMSADLVTEGMCVLVEEGGAKGGVCVCVCISFTVVCKGFICLTSSYPHPLHPTSRHSLTSSHSPLSIPSHSHLQWPATGVSSDQGPLW